MNIFFCFLNSVLEQGKLLYMKYKDILFYVAPQLRTDPIWSHAFSGHEWGPPFSAHSIRNLMCKYWWTSTSPWGNIILLKVVVPASCKVFGTVIVAKSSFEIYPAYSSLRRNVREILFVSWISHNPFTPLDFLLWGLLEYIAFSVRIRSPIFRVGLSKW